MLRKLLLTGAALVAVFVYAAPAMADSSIGRPIGTTGCQNGFAFFESVGTTYTVPSGLWQLSSWSTQAGALGGQMAAVVVRPTGTPGTYTVVAVSALENLTPNTLNTFAVSIPVEAGDILGAWIGGSSGQTSCVDTSGGTVELGFMALPSAGDTLSGLSSFTGQPNIGGVLSPYSARTEDSMFLCYSKWEQDGGAVFTVDQAEQLLASGWWLPTAVAGNIAGGDNLGGYHLVCNPPTGLTATGQYVDDGGNILEPDAAGF
ncbi:MAG TPA: hypothetical protein VKY26_05555, partial [Actinomycetota bacterium]|nr:hypothetical protein [Actinomycetota bacterium]